MTEAAVRTLLLEQIHPDADEILTDAGFSVESISRALDEDELIERLAEATLVGIRSKTQITRRVIESAPKLQAIGAYCIGTNQIDLAAANDHGVTVFNAPFSNTRSVVELAIAEIISMTRRLTEKNNAMHAGVWDKSAEGAHEVRGRTLGIVGYGHIGSQVGVLAEAFGMRVVFYDIVAKLPMGNNRALARLEDVLEASDFVTLHVPETPQTKNMIGRAEIARMKPGACLLNASRGTVVEIDALADGITRGHIGGAAVDVYPDEPESNSDGFASQLCGLPNVILTPHIGGSTEEAQEAIGREVSAAVIKWINQGSTLGAVNFPHVDLPITKGTHRILNIHKNVPGVLRDINKIVSDRNANIRAQHLSTDPEIGYLVMDLDQDVSNEVKKDIAALETSIRTRILF